MLPRMFRLLLAGTFTGEMVRIISNIRREHGKGAVKLDDCGRFVLADDLSDIADITHIDLSNIRSLEGKSTTTIRIFLHPSFTAREFSGCLWQVLSLVKLFVSSAISAASTARTL